jgi:hypothetical protein
MFDLIIHGEIEQGLSLSVQAVLDKMAGEPVSCLVNSPGGDAWEGAAIMAQFHRHGAVSVTIEGVCASAASLLVMGAARIVMSESAVMMIHDPSCYAQGTRKELRKAASPMLAALPGTVRSMQVIEDGVVPPVQLAKYLFHYLPASSRSAFLVLLSLEILTPRLMQQRSLWVLLAKA